MPICSAATALMCSTIASAARRRVRGVWRSVGGRCCITAGRRSTAIRAKGPDGKLAWYDENGRSTKRQFLASPLKFNPRVTSRVSPSIESIRSSAMSARISAWTTARHMGLAGAGGNAGHGVIGRAGWQRREPDPVAARRRLRDVRTCILSRFAAGIRARARTSIRAR